MTTPTGWDGGLLLLGYDGGLREGGGGGGGVPPEREDEEDEEELEAETVEVGSYVKGMPPA